MFIVPNDGKNYFLAKFFEDFDNFVVPDADCCERIKNTFEKFGFSPKFQEDNKSFIIESNFDENYFIKGELLTGNSLCSINVCIGDTSCNIIKQVSPYDLESVIPLFNMAFLLLEKLYYVYGCAASPVICDSHHIDRLNEIDEAIAKLLPLVSNDNEEYIRRISLPIEKMFGSTDAELGDLITQLVNLMDEFGIKEFLLHPLDDRGKASYNILKEWGFNYESLITRFALIDSELVCRFGEVACDTYRNKFVIRHVSDRVDDIWIHYSKVPVVALKEAIMWCLNFNTIRNYSKMHPGCRIYDKSFNIHELIASYSNSRSIAHAFAGLTVDRLDLKGLNFASFDDYEAMFRNCVNLRELTLYAEKSEPSKTKKNFRQIFKNCRSLQTITLHGFDDNLTKMIRRAIRADISTQVEIVINPSNPS